MHSGRCRTPFDLDARAVVARDHVPRSWTGSANSVADGASADQHASGAVTQIDGARDVGANQISFDDIVTRSAVVDDADTFTSETIDHEPAECTIGASSTCRQSVRVRAGADAIQLDEQHAVQSAADRVRVRARPRLSVAVDSHRLGDHRQGGGRTNRVNAGTGYVEANGI